VAILEQQPKTGRSLTDTVVRLAMPSAIKQPDERAKLCHAMELFVRVYEPHEAREDTVLFPAFRKFTPQA
jgi:hypothetical protein